jgi:phosphopantetheine--protein transferase-like protein
MITKIEKLSPNSALVVNKIENLVGNSMEFLSFREKLTLSNISHLEKHKEWMAARVVMNQALQCFEIPYPGFYKDEYGKSHPMEHIGHVSISHTRGLVAAIYHQNLPVGIDVERIQPKISKLASKFLSKDEIDHIGDDPKKLTMAWSSKEAAYKIFGKKGISLKDNIRIIQEDLNQPIWNLKLESAGITSYIYPIQIEIHEDVVLSYSNW